MYTSLHTSFLVKQIATQFFKFLKYKQHYRMYFLNDVCLYDRILVSYSMYYIIYSYRVKILMQNRTILKYKTKRLKTFILTSNHFVSPKAIKGNGINMRCVWRSCFWKLLILSQMWYDGIIIIITVALHIESNFFACLMSSMANFFLSWKVHLLVPFKQISIYNNFNTFCDYFELKKDYNMKYSRGIPLSYILTTKDQNINGFI